MEELTHKIERMFLRGVLEGLKNKSLVVKDARASARALLDVEPFASLDDAKAKTAKLTESFPLFTGIRDYVNSYSEELQIQNVVDKMQKLIKNDSIDEALEVAQSKK